MTIQSGTHAIESMQLEERRYPPPPEFAKNANAKPDIYNKPFEDFWKEEALKRVSWFQPFDRVLEWKLPYAKWFLGGKLNVCYNCVDRHVEAGRGDKVAYYWEGEPIDQKRTITFKDLLADVVRFANALKKLGVKKGTPVGIYMGMVPELPVAMLACTRLGAPHTVVFGGFSADDPLLHLRRQARLGVLVRRRHRLGHRAQLYRLRAAVQRHYRRHLRGRPRLPRQGSLVVDHRALQDRHPVYGADRDPHPYEVGPGIR